MRRIFTVELTAREALTVQRMARLSGLTPEQLVRKPYRVSVFDCIVSLSTGVWSWFDPRSGTSVRHRRRRQRMVRQFTGDMLGGIEQREREQTISGRTGIAPHRVQVGSPLVGHAVLPI